MPTKAGIHRTRAWPTWRRTVAGVLMALVAMGCIGNVPAQQAVPPPASEAASDPLVRDIGRMLRTRLEDPDALETFLQARFGPSKAGTHFDSRIATRGRFAGAALERIELLSGRDTPGKGILHMEFGASSPRVIQSPWPGALPSPPRPDAAASPAYWEVQDQGTTIILVLAPDQAHVRQITVRQP